MTKSVIKHVSHPYAPELWQARMDQAHITNQPMVERPWWYEDTSGNTWHDLYACIGWPSEVSDKDTGMPGYAAIVGIERPKQLDMETHYNPVDARFFMLAETQSKDVPTLIDQCVAMREVFGFGSQPSLLQVWFGDPDRFLTTLALKNEWLIKQGGDNNALLVTPPDDYYTPMIFDNYVRSLQSCLIKDKERLFLRSCEIIRSRINEFFRDDPAILAIGGLIHSSLSRCMWMSQTEQGAGCFTVEERV